MICCWTSPNRVTIATCFSSTTKKICGPSIPATNAATTKMIATNFMLNPYGWFRRDSAGRTLVCSVRGRNWSRPPPASSDTTYLVMPGIISSIASRYNLWRVTKGAFSYSARIERNLAAWPSADAIFSCLKASAPCSSAAAWPLDLGRMS